MVKTRKKTQKQRQKKQNKSRKNAWDEPNQAMLSLQYITKLIKDYV
jgi:hypothetical protein